MTNNQKFTDRLKNVQLFLSQHRLDGFLVTDMTNINYLTGFPGDEGLLLITLDCSILISDARFEVELTQQTEYDYQITSDYFKTVCDLFVKEHLAAVGFEESISYHDYDYLDENSVADIVPIENLVEYQRSFKDEIEIDVLRKGAKIAAKGYQELLNKIQPGMTEKEIATFLDYRMRINGAEKQSFETIIASGVNNTVKPHSIPSDRQVQQNDLILVDFGYFYQGYTTDLTRVFSLGEQTNEVKQMYQAVKEALNETSQIVCSGASISTLWQKAYDVLEKYHLGKYFTHGIGHGIGKSIHELPSLSIQNLETLAPGQVITIEPGIYVPGKGGIRLENDLLITENGFENLTDFGLEYIEL